MNGIAGALALLFFAAPAARASFFPGSPFSDKAAGTTSAAFLKLPTGARAEALGGTYAAAASGAEAAFWNPAGLARLEEAGRSDGHVRPRGRRRAHGPARLEEAGRSDLGFSYNILLEGSYASALSYARSVPGVGVLGAALAYFSAGSVQGYDALANKTGAFSPNDLALLLSYAKKLERVSLGGQLEWVRSSVADVSAMAVAVGFGAQARRVYLSEDEEGEVGGGGALDVGVSVRHLGPPMKIGGASDPLPFKLQPGVLWHFNPRVAASLDGHLPVDQDPYPSLGIEGTLPLGETSRGSLRGGYNLSNQRGLDWLAGFALGFGLDLARLRLDYAWAPRGDLGATHRVTFGLSF